MPVALISTTNMLSYNAPDITTIRQVSGSSSPSSVSSDNSDAHSFSSANESSLTDASSVGNSPTDSYPPKNHLSGYFAAATNRSVPSSPELSTGMRSPSLRSPRRTASTTSLQKAPTTESKPAIPQRALSHSKASHEHLARQRSLRNSSSTGRISRVSREQRSSIDIFKVCEDPSHPFGNELEQLKEVVEEFGGVVHEVSQDEDHTFMLEQKLARFDATDYLREIQPLVAGIMNRQIVAIQTGWI